MKSLRIVLLIDFNKILWPLKTCTPEQSIGKTDADFVLPEEAKRLTEVKQRVLQTGKGEHRELQTTSPGGTFLLSA